MRKIKQTQSQKRINTSSNQHLYAHLFINLTKDKAQVSLYVKYLVLQCFNTENSCKEKMKEQ